MNNTYTVTNNGETFDVDAYDFNVTGGICIFTDHIGRAMRVIAVCDDLSIECAYGANPLFEAREQLAVAQARQALADIEAEVAKLGRRH